MKHTFLIAAWFLLACACTKDTRVAETPPAAYLMVYNGAPSLYGVNGFSFINSNLHKSSTYNSNGRNVVGAYSYSFYNLIDTGLVRISYNDSATVPEQAKKLLETTYTFEPDQHYTLYLLDSASYYASLVTKDDEAPSPTQAKIRFVHLSPDAGKIFLSINNEIVTAIGHVGYKEVTNFTTVTPDLTPGIRVQYKHPDTGEDLTLIRKSFPMEAGKCYTIILRGSRSPKDNNPNKTINLSTITNF